MSIININDDIDVIVIIYNLGKGVQAPSRVRGPGAADGELLPSWKSHADLTGQ